MESGSLDSLEIGGARLTLDDVSAIATGERAGRVASDPGFRERIDAGARFLDEILARDGVIYGVTTGYGDSCSVTVPAELVTELPKHLYTFHGCGLGRFFDPVETRAILVARMASLATGFSGIRWVLLERLGQLLDHDVLPLIPAEGSVGASGDLTPLSYVAAVLAGEREVWHRGVRRPAAEALREEDIEPLRLRPKEALALMNGTAVMTGLACLAFRRGEYLARLASRVTALATHALKGNDYHFDGRLFETKPHPGQQQAAAWIRADLGDHAVTPESAPRLQDRYSIRCAPHVIGVFMDSAPLLRSLIENELNSANDNPIIDAVGRRVLHGGHFYGGHIAFAMDSLKNLVANMADLLDRQLALLVDPRYSHGLPANLSGASGPRASINHGFKAVQIAASAWTAEALKLTMPASVFSRSTECHNQDKVSMGTIAARDALRVLELTEQVTAAVLLAAAQGVVLRDRTDETPTDCLAPPVRGMLTDIFSRFRLVEEDRALDHDLQQTIGLIRARHWPLYA